MEKAPLRIKSAFRLVWGASSTWTLSNIALVIVQGTLPLAMLYLTKLVIDSLTHGMMAGERSAAFANAIMYILAMGGVALATALCRSLSTYVSEAQSILVTDHVQSILHSKSIEVDLQFYENTQYFDKLHRAQQEAPYRPTRIVNGLVQLAQSGLSLVAVAGLLFAFHWSVAIVLFVASIPGAVVRLKYADTMYRWRRKRTQTERRASYLHNLLTGEHYAKEVRLFGLGQSFIERFKNLRQQLRGERLAIAKRRSWMDALTQASGLIAIYAAFAFLAHQAMEGAITIGDVVMYFQAFQRGQAFMSEILTSAASLYEDNLFLSSFTEFVALTPKIISPTPSVAMPVPMQRGITFDHVSFDYPETHRRVLHDVSFSVAHGEHVALVGENGAGKTTLVKLLCRLYDPCDGKIEVDGIDIRNFDVKSYRKEISIIFQDYARYNFTARDNILFGNINLSAQDDQIIAAAKKSGADSVITGLRNGYDTTLGKLFDGGEELSIGEWQKIALGRAFLRNAQIIVLDEPTSALDPMAEAEVCEKFHQLAAGRTAFLISHRLSTVKMADRILVLQDGTIVESGTHDDLLSRAGNYARLFETQAKNYR